MAGAVILQCGSARYIDPLVITYIFLNQLVWPNHYVNWVPVSSLFLNSIAGVPKPPGWGPVPVRGLLGTGPYGKRWAAGKRAQLCLPLSIPAIVCITTWTRPTSTGPRPWKSCLPQNRALVPERLGTTALQHAEFIRTYNNLKFLLQVV